MTDRYHALVVVLEKDTRDDDAEHLINAIKMMRGVLSVEGQVSDINIHTAYERAKHELGQKVLNVLYPERSKG
jgi:hypothetical protein